MLSALCKCTNVETIICQLPVDQIVHMSNVGMLVGVMADLITKNNVFSANADTYRYFGDAALYHDIGKVYLPHEILTKPGKLTSEEYRWIQKHTLFANTLFRQIKNGEISGIEEHLIILAHNAAVYHHEWWNGEGYPFGLSYGEIPFIARVTSVCDAYDAMTGSRPYHKARSHEYACGELERNAGTQFDPDIVKIFLNYESEIRDLIDSRA